MAAVLQPTTGARVHLARIDRALDEIEAFVPKHEADELDVLAARVDALRLQLYIVNELLRVVVEAMRPGGQR